jgi:hypothetical protein
MTLPARGPRRHGQCRLLLQIGEDTYSVVPLPKDESPALGRTWRVRKIAGKDRVGAQYACGVIVFGPRARLGCSCPDHLINNATCKHLSALQALGLLPKRPRARVQLAAREGVAS